MYMYVVYLGLTRVRMQCFSFRILDQSSVIFFLSVVFCRTIHAQKYLLFIYYLFIYLCFFPVVLTLHFFSFSLSSLHSVYPLLISKTVIHVTKYNE